MKSSRNNLVAAVSVTVSAFSCLLFQAERVYKLKNGRNLVVLIFPILVMHPETARIARRMSGAVENTIDSANKTKRHLAYWLVRFWPYDMGPISLLITGKVKVPNTYFSPLCRLVMIHTRAIRLVSTKVMAWSWWKRFYHTFWLICPSLG